MAGETFLNDVTEGLETMVASARTTREYPANVMLKNADRQTLKAGTGTAWREFQANQLSAQDYGETDVIDNPQQFDGSILTLTPTLVAIHTAIGDRVALRLNTQAFGTFGQSNQRAIDRKKDQDCLLVFASAGTTLVGSGATLTSGSIAAGVERIASNATEPWDGPICAVLHGYGIHDIRSEAIGGVGSYPIPEGYTADAWKNGITGLAINGAEIYRDGLIAVDSTPDARGGVFAKGPGGAIIVVQGKSPWKSERYDVNVGYGLLNVYLKDEYVIGERSAGNWLFGLLHDATAPSYTFGSPNKDRGERKMAQPTDTSRGLSPWRDDFDRAAIDTTNIWSTNSDTGGTAFAINSQTNGVVRGGVDTSDNDITNLFGHKVFRLDESPATVEIRAKPVTSVADGETFIGITDSIATDENPITLSTADVQTNNATDGVGFAYTGAGTADWKRVAVNNGSTPTGSPTRCNARGATTPVVGTWQTFKVALSNEGHARFWLNGVEQGTIDSAVRTTVLLNVGIALQSGGTARSLDVDYVEIVHGRRMTA